MHFARQIPSRFAVAGLSGLLLACCLLSAQQAPTQPQAAQPQEVGNPAHLQSGVNRGTLDKSAAGQYWDFYATPGKFQLVVAAGSPMESFAAGQAPQVSVTFVPQTPGASLTQRAIPLGGTVFSGAVTARTHVRVAVEPARGRLARQTVEYTLVATGNVDFSEVASAAGAEPDAGPGVVGAYAVAGGWAHAGGVARFTADGKIVTTTGLRGTWSFVFDSDNQTYVVNIGPDSRVLRFEPGLGFLDVQSRTLALEARR